MKFEITDFENVDVDIKDLIDLVLSDNNGADSAPKEGGAVPIGFAPIDDLLGGGLRKGDLCLAGAMPAMGKTTFVSQIAGNIARQGRKVVFFSTEFGSQQMKNLFKAQGNQGAGVILDCKQDINPTYVKCVLEHTRAEVAVIDFFDNFTYASDEQAADIAFELRQIAEELQVVIICAKYLEKKRNGNPVLADLSPAEIEQDANVILFINRDSYSPDDSAVFIKVMLAKNRYGDLGEIETAYDIPARTFNIVE